MRLADGFYLVLSVVPAEKRFDANKERLSIAAGGSPCNALQKGALALLTQPLLLIDQEGEEYAFSIFSINCLDVSMPALSCVEVWK